MDRILYACSQPHSLIVGYLALSIEPSAVSLKEFMCCVLCSRDCRTSYTLFSPQLSPLLTFGPCLLYHHPPPYNLHVP
jgi:hypothetical protein